MAGKDLKNLPVTMSGLTRKQFMKKYGFDPLKISSGIHGSTYISDKD